MYRSKLAWRQSSSVLLLLILAFTATVGAVSSPPLAASGVDLDTFYDNYNDNSIDTSLWTVGTLGPSDSQVPVTEVNGQLTILPRANQTGDHFRGLISTRTYNLTAGLIFAEVPEIAQANAQTILAFGNDNNNKISMFTQGGNLLMRLTIGGTTVGAASVAYNSTSHRWWRIRHVATGDTIRFDTSPDGIIWTQRHSIGRGSLNIAAGKVNVSAGTSAAVAAPGRARFDNLSWHPLIPNKGDWSAPTTALTPNPTAGTWDHILWGAASPSTMVKFNGTYFLYYIGAEGDNGEPQYEAVRRSLGVATSSDGIRFTKYSGNPILRYTTTNGTATQEGVGSATAIVVGNTIHLYYGAIRSIGNGLVDMDIRYRKSTDGYNFTNDTLIFRSAGNEYSPLGVTNVGSAWSVYIKGPLTDGRGALSRLSGTSPTSLPNRTSVTSTTFGAGGNANFITNNLFLLHLDRRQPAEDQFQVRVINTGSPNSISEPLFSYTFGNYADEVTPATFSDSTTGTWFMYTLNLTVEPAVISVRKYVPPNNVIPTSTPLATLTRTPTSSVPRTVTPKSIIADAAGTPIPGATFTPTSTPAAKSTTTPTVGASQTMSVVDLDARSTSVNGNLEAEVMITVLTSDNLTVANANVTGVFSNGATGTCITDASGICSIASGPIPPGGPALTFSVTSVSHATLIYSSSNNRDIDSESNGTMITIPAN